ncbi:MAG: DUF2309 domain-containing protein [Pseudohongiellaceae bacterium]
MSRQMADTIGELINTAAKILPSQSPLHVFVHHNTLHAYENSSFKEALHSASKDLGAEPFMTEQCFKDAADSGRVLLSDIESVLDQEVDDLDSSLFIGAPTRRAILLWRLNTLFNVPEKTSVRWWLHEKGYLDKAHKLAGSAVNSPASSLFFQSRRQYQPGELRTLWDNLNANAPAKLNVNSLARPRDYLATVFDRDTDEWVKPAVIRLAAAYLDQGIGSLPQPDKADGFLISFRRMYAIGASPTPSWMKGIGSECRMQEEQSLGARDVIARVMDYFEIEEAHRQAFITQSLQLLRGWAGMFRQFEKEPEKAPVSAFPATLEDFLAVQLTLEMMAFKAACRDCGTDQGQYRQFVARHGIESRRGSKSIQDIYEAFITAQAFDLPASLFSSRDKAGKWVEEIGKFNSFERRYLLQLAYERRHRHHVLDGLHEHRRFMRDDKNRQVAFQAVLCMDEREESMRRHIEEISSESETFGFAGFFGVAMHYQGFDDVTPRPLCPVNRTPQHYVREVALDEKEAERYQRFRKLVGTYSKTVINHEAVISFGPAWSLLMGIAKSPALVFRSLFPRWSEMLSKKFDDIGPPRPKTRLHLFREDGDPRQYGMETGYSVEEAADVVASMLSSMGMTENFAPIVLIVGHGSSSLNNPHEAAHDCGATGGGRGGPNARAFALMANHPQVRTLLRRKGIELSEDSWLVGAYHNTCNDEMEYYDTELIPTQHTSAFEHACTVLQEACQYDALERCRKFAEVPPDVSRENALGFATQHSIDLAQPRPEYGHATNAVAIIGRRELTKGLFLDRRSFLISYDPAKDPDKSIIAGLLESAGPVGAGINLEYYFSFVDPVAFGCGTKLPHNIAGLVGVMEGHCSDLRTGLPWQMVEIHEPVRLLTIVEAAPQDLLTIARERPVVGTLVGNEWIQLVSLHPDTGELKVFHKGAFIDYVPERTGYPVAARSEKFFRGAATYLGLAHITEQDPGEQYVSKAAI